MVSIESIRRTALDREPTEAGELRDISRSSLERSRRDVGEVLSDGIAAATSVILTAAGDDRSARGCLPR